MYCHLLLVLDDGEFYGPEAGGAGAGASGLGPGATGRRPPQANGGGDPFSLAQCRAIVTSLNSLVFHTYLPKAVHTSASAAVHPPHPHAPGPSSGFGGGGWGGGGGGGWGGASGPPPSEAPALLAEFAPALLRSLYERDVR